MTALTPEDSIRYSRQIMYPELGKLGQLKLKEAHVVVAGLGGLGSPASIYLACAGVGHITVIDHDRVELSNLNRQIVHWDEDIDVEKPLSAARKLIRLNPSITVTPVVAKITKDNARQLIQGVSVVIDAMDNFETRFIINEACVAERIPFIHAGIYGLLGQITTIIPGKTPCLSCIVPCVPTKRKPPPVFGVTPALMATLQVTEAIKLIAGFGNLLTGKLLCINAAKMEFDLVTISRRPDCEICGGIKT